MQTCTVQPKCFFQSAPKRDFKKQNISQWIQLQGIKVSECLPGQHKIADAITGVENSWHYKHLFKDSLDIWENQNGMFGMNSYCTDYENYFSKSRVILLFIMGMLETSDVFVVIN